MKKGTGKGTIRRAYVTGRPEQWNTWGDGWIYGSAMAMGRGPCYRCGAMVQWARDCPTKGQDGKGFPKGKKRPFVSIGLVPWGLKLPFQCVHD